MKRHRSSVQARTVISVSISLACAVGRPPSIVASFTTTAKSALYLVSASETTVRFTVASVGITSLLGEWAAPATTARAKAKARKEVGEREGG